MVEISEHSVADTLAGETHLIFLVEHFGIECPPNKSLLLTIEISESQRIL